jgi:D-glycero-D-manno-heptose 1,7-bisphosphate phosphatase
MIAIIFDRDGTIIHNKHYLCDPDQVELIKGSKKAFQVFSKSSKCLFFLHTNQSGIERGFFKMNDVLKVNDKMFNLLGIKKNFFSKICIAPEINFSENNYRKPSSKFIDEIVNEFNLEYKNIYYVGDSQCEYDLSKKTGCNFYEIRVDNKPNLTRNPLKSIYDVAIQIKDYL